MKKQITSDILRSSTQSSSASSLGSSRFAFYSSIYGSSTRKAAPKQIPTTLNPVEYLNWKPTYRLSMQSPRITSNVLSPKPLKKVKQTFRTALNSRLERARQVYNVPVPINPQKIKDSPKRNPSTMPVSPQASVLSSDSKPSSDQTPMSPKSVGETFSSLLDFERDTRNHKTWSISKPVEPMAKKSPVKEKSRFLDIQPVVNLRRVDTFELLRSDSDVKLPEISHPPKDQKSRLGKVLEIDELERNRRASVTSQKDMKDWISDYNSATAAVLTDTKFLIKDQRTGHSVPERLLRV